MPRGRPIHTAQRAIADLTVGVAKATKAREKWRSELGLTEYDQQYQFPIRGTAGVVPTFTFVAITLDFPIHYAPGQRDSDLERPHVSVGSHIDVAVMVGISIKEWVTDPDSGAHTGADIWVSAVAANDGTDFSGYGHVTFQGFSAADEAEVTTLET